MKSWHSGLLIASLSLYGCSAEPIRKTHTDSTDTESADSGATTSKASATEKDATGMAKVQALYQQGQYKEALSAIEATPESDVPASEKAEYHNLKGLLLLGQKKPIQAESSFKKALQTNQTPNYRGYYQYNLATAEYDADQFEEAQDTLNSIDLQSVDSGQQKKVLTLKEKIASRSDKKAPSNSEVATTAPVPAPTAKVATPVDAAAASTTAAAVTPSASATPAPAPAETYSGPVNSHRIGLLLPLTGKYETFGKRAQKAIELAFQHSPDPHAKEYELIAVDAGETPAAHADALKKLVEENQVIAVIGPLLSKGIETLATSAAYYQVPMISIAQAQGPVGSDLFSCSISTKNQISKIVEYAMKGRGFSKFAILAPSNKPGEEMAHAFWDEVTSRQGEIKAFELYDPEITDFRKPVDKSIGLFYTDARSEDVNALNEKRKELNITRKTMKTNQYFELTPIVDFDAVFIADEAKVVGQIIPTFAYRNAKNLSYLGITTWNSPQLIQRAQEQAEGATFPVAFNTLSPPPSTKAFYDLFVSTYSSYPGEFDSISFDAATLAIRTLQDSPSSRDDFRKTLEKISHIDSASGDLSIHEHRCSRDLALYTVQKGKFVVADERTIAEQVSDQSKKAVPSPSPEKSAE